MLKQIVKLAYSILSNIFNPNRLCVCRFEPSCSAYASQAIDSHGTIGGSFLIFRRLIKCRPWGPSGYDPIPLQQTHKS